MHNDPFSAQTKEVLTPQEKRRSHLMEGGSASKVCEPHMCVYMYKQTGAQTLTDSGRSTAHETMGAFAGGTTDKDPFSTSRLKLCRWGNVPAKKQNWATRDLTNTTGRLTGRAVPILVAMMVAAL